MAEHETKIVIRVKDEASRAFRAAEDAAAKLADAQRRLIENQKLYNLYSSKFGPSDRDSKWAARELSASRKEVSALQKEFDNANDAMKRAKGAMEGVGGAAGGAGANGLMRMVRAFEMLSRGNIPGALRAFGGLSAALMKFAGIGGLVALTWKGIQSAVLKFNQSRHETAIKRMSDEMAGLNSRTERSKRLFDDLRKSTNDAFSRATNRRNAESATAEAAYRAGNAQIGLQNLERLRGAKTPEERRAIQAQIDAENASYAKGHERDLLNDKNADIDAREKQYAKQRESNDAEIKSTRHLIAEIEGLAAQANDAADAVDSTKADFIARRFGLDVSAEKERGDYAAIAQKLYAKTPELRRRIESLNGENKNLAAQSANLGFERRTAQQEYEQRIAEIELDARKKQIAAEDEAAADAAKVAEENARIDDEIAKKKDDIRKALADEARARADEAAKEAEAAQNDADEAAARVLDIAAQKQTARKSRAERRAERAEEKNRKKSERQFDAMTEQIRRNYSAMRKNGLTDEQALARMPREWREVIEKERERRAAEQKARADQAAAEQRRTEAEKRRKEFEEKVQKFAPVVDKIEQLRKDLIELQKLK